MNAITEITAAPDYDAIKQKQNAAWASGDYARIGTTLQVVGEDLAESMDLDLVILDNDSGDERVTLPLNDDVALVTLPVVQYRSGTRHDVRAVTQQVRDHGGLVVWDASHAGARPWYNPLP